MGRPMTGATCVGCRVAADDAHFDPDCPLHGAPQPEPPRRSIFESERHYIIEYLRSDLYERRDVAGDDLGMTWVSPLNWKVRIFGDRDDPSVQIFWPDGRLYRSADHASVGWVAEALP